MITLTLVSLMIAHVAIEGRVRDARTHTAIAAARVELSGVEMATDYQFTDNAGRFRFAVPSQGGYTITVAVAGYQPAILGIESTSITFPIDIGLRRISSAAPAKNAYRDDCAAAARDLPEGLRLVEPNAAAENDLGNCYRKLGDLQRSEDAFKRAFALTSSVYVALNLAEVYTAQKRFAEGEGLLNGVIQKQPGAGDAYYGLALIYVEQQRFEEAETALMKADQRPHKIADVHLLLAQVYERQHRNRDAIQQLRVYVKEAPRSEQSKRVRNFLRRSS